MGLDSTIIGILIGVFQLVLLVFAGILLTKLGPLDRIGELKFALANYYLLIPLFSAIEIAKASDPSNIVALGLLTLTFIASCGLTILFTAIYCWVSQMDVRSNKSFIMVAAFANIAFFPAVVVDSLCGENGVLNYDEHCKYGYGYSMFGIFLLNSVVWSAGPFILSRDKVISFNIRRQMYVIKQFYGSYKEFMEDTELNKMEKIQQEKFAELLQRVDNMEQSHKEIFMKPQELDSTLLEDPELITFSHQAYLGRAEYEKFQTHFERFLEKVHPAVFAQITENLPGPAKPPQATFKAVVYKVLTPPVVACVIGIVIGLIPPVQDWIFSSWAKQIFMDTSQNVGAMAVTVSVMLLGCKLAGGFTFTKDVNLRFKDLVGIVVIRFVLIPTTGLGYMLALSGFGVPQIENDRILSFVMYSYWCVPPSVIFISLFLMLKHYTKEIALIQFWTNVLSVVAAPVFLLAYFAIFPA